MPLDELPRDAGPHAIELARPVRRLAEQDDLRLRKPPDQSIDRPALEILDRLALLGDHRRKMLALRAAQPRRMGRPMLGQRRAVRRPALGADERHELHAPERLAIEVALARAHDAQQLLRARLATDRDHQPTAIGKLLEQALGHLRPARRDDDRVVGSVLGQAERAVATDDVDVRESQRLHPRLGELRQRLVPLDRMHLSRHAAEHRRGVARSRADLEHAITGTHASGLDHRRHDERLGDRLPRLDRQRRVVVGELAHRRFDERLARHRAHRLQHPVVADAPRRDLQLDHLDAPSCELFHARR